MISVVATLSNDTIVTASRGYPAGGGDDTVTLYIDGPFDSPSKAIFTVEEFEQFVRVLGFLT